jgi:hypothetical protein
VFQMPNGAAAGKRRSCAKGVLFLCLGSVRKQKLFFFQCGKVPSSWLRIIHYYFMFAIYMLVMYITICTCKIEEAMADARLWSKSKIMNCR